MVTVQDLRELLKKLDKQRYPVIMEELCREEEWITLGVVEKALVDGGYPKRPSGKMKPEVERDYKDRFLEFLCRFKGGDLVVVEPETDPKGFMESKAAITSPEAINGIGILTPQVASKSGSPRTVPPPEGMTRMMVNIPIESHMRLKVMAAGRKTTVTKIILDFVETALKKESQPRDLFSPDGPGGFGGEEPPQK
jgi:hypothetical protein